VDGDAGAASNLQREIVDANETLGTQKVDSAKAAIEALNKDVHVKTYNERLTSQNVDRILADGWDLIVDGADNFPTRYLVNDASVWHDIPVVHGSIYRFEGQVTVFKPHEGPCYRCLFPQPPPPELAPSCAEGGVLGVLPGLRRQRDDHRVRRLRRVLRRQAGSRMTTVRIPPTLRPEVGGERQVPAQGETVRAVLEDLTSRFPGLGRQIFEDDGEIATFVNVYVEGEDVRTLDGLDTPVHDGQTVILLPAMAG